MRHTLKTVQNMKALVDSRDNIIGDGTCHADYDVYDFAADGYDFIKSSVSLSETTESVYVYYRNTRNGNVACVRFSWHTCNAVRFGDVLEWTDKNEILYRLGLKGKKPVDDFKTGLSICFRDVKKIDADKYEQADLSISEMYKLGAGASLAEYKGKLAKGSRHLILSDTVKEYTEKVGVHYEYYDLI